MIKLFPQRLKRFLDISEVEQPAGLIVHRAFAGKFDSETMPMKPRAFVPVGDVWQMMGGFKTKLPNQSNSVAAFADLDGRL